MRKDLKDVIVNIPRSKSGGRSKYKGRDRDPKKNSKEYWELDKAPSKKFSKELRDRLAPAIRFLEKNKDRIWDDVWSEVCSNNDNRNIRGYHLREHILGLVNLNGISKEYPWAFPQLYPSVWSTFFVDKKGFLRKMKGK